MADADPANFMSPGRRRWYFGAVIFLPLLGLLSCSMSAEDAEVRHYKAMASVDLWNGYETAQFANGT
jgi:hypothetical protein